MNVKSLISNLLDLSKSASFVLAILLSLTICHQIAAVSTSAEKTMVCDGGPTVDDEDDDDDKKDEPKK